MNLYQKIRKKHQEEINAFPLHAAFGNEQFDKMCKELGLSMSKSSKNYYGKRLVSIGCGTFCLKEDAPRLAEMLKDHSRQIDDLVAADKTGDGFIFDMFYYELCNHEYGYTGDPEDTLDALGFKMEQIEADPRLANGFGKACYAASHLPE